MDSALDRTWAAFAELATGFYSSAVPAEPVVAEGWFCALSRTASAELNVCGLSPAATAASAHQLLDTLGVDQPGIVFTSAHLGTEVRGILATAGFTFADTAEPLMQCLHPPKVTSSGFVITRAQRAVDLETALRLTSSAHTVDVALLDATIGEAARSGAADVWLAHDGNEPVSTVWLCRSRSTIGVMEMMTPVQHQGRGAGRALLTVALAETWSATTADAVLIATPAGRRLYESVGFIAIDESVTCYRGLEDSVLTAIGQ